MENSDVRLLEPSLLEYARFHGLAIDHLEVDHFDDLLTSYRHNLLDWVDPPGAPALTFSPPNTKESIQCSREVGSLLTSVMKRSGGPPWELVLSEYLKAPNPKMELPLLKTEHEEDMRGFGRKEVPSDTMFNLLLADIDEKNDEGYTWPSWYEDYPRKCMHSVLQEKLSIPKEAWLYLQKTRRNQVRQEDINSVFDQCTSYERKRVLEPMTPPLLPFEPDPTPYTPCSSTCELQLLSDHTSPLTKEHTKAEEALRNEKFEPPNIARRILSQDEMLLDRIHFEGSPLEQLLDLPRTPTRAFNLTDLRVSPLLIPSAPTLETTGNDVSILLDEMAREAEIESYKLSDVDEKERNKQLFELAKQASDLLEENLRQERPSGEEIKLRVEVPQLDFAFPSPPWKPHGYGFARDSGDLPAALLKGVIESLPSEYFWPFEPLKERQLQWRLFPPEKAQVNLRETFEESDCLASLLEKIRIGGNVYFDDILPEIGTVRLSKDSESQENEVLTLEQPERMPSSMVATAERVSSNEVDRRLSSHSPLDLSLGNQRTSLFTEPLVPRKRAANNSFPSQSFFPGDLNLTNRAPSGKLSTVDPLSVFMQSRGIPTKKLRLTDTDNSYFSKKHIDNAFIDSPSANYAATSVISPEGQQAVGQNTASLSSLSLPTHPITLVVPLTLEKSHRLLINSLMVLAPSTEIIDRDYLHSKLHLRPSQIFSTNSTISDPEADIALSPSAAIILTSIPQITQTSLPGHGPSTSPIRIRITNLSLLYERIYVFVNATSNSPSLDASTCAAFTSLSAFCTSLAEISTISTIFMLSSEVKVLALHILELASKHCLDLPKTGRGVTMLPEETTWELFLRAAGLNTYAAQALVNLVKKPDGELSDGVEGMEINMPRQSKYWGSSSSEGVISRERRLWGLQLILHITSREREERFGDVMEGMRVLRRMGERLDVHWG